MSQSLEGVAEGEVRALHRTRVACRRLRELLPVVSLDGETRAGVARRLRKVTKRLGTLRELDVLLILIDELHESGRLNSTAFETLKREIADHRKHAERALEGKHIAKELQKIARKLTRNGERESVDQRGCAARRSFASAVEARQARRAAALKEAILAAGSVYLPERLHEVRIRLKKLRYSVELSAEISAEAAQRELRLMRRVQALLGRMHDLQVLIDHVRQLQGTSTLATERWRDLGAVVTLLEHACRRLHARYVREQPALVAISDRFGARAAPRHLSATRRVG